MQVILILIENTNLYPASLNANTGNWTRIDRIDNTKKSIIDYILVSNNLKDEIDNLTIDENGHLRAKGKKETDHNTITMSINIKTTKQGKTKATRNYYDNPDDWKKVNRYIKQELKDQREIHYEKMEKAIKQAIRTHIKQKTITLENRKKITNPTIKQKREEMKEARRNFERETPNTIEKENKLKGYFKAQNELKIEIQKEEKNKTEQKIKSIIEQGGANSNNFWKITKEIKRIEDENYDLITEEGNTVTDPEEAKKYIEQYYENLYKVREPDNEYSTWKRIIQQRNIEHKEQAEADTTFPDFTMKELNEVISQLKNKKANGPDGIPNEFLKNADQEVKKVL